MTYRKVHLPEQGGERHIAAEGGLTRPDAASRRAHAWTHGQWTPLARALAATGDRWKLLIVLALMPGPVRLVRLQERLPGVSAGVLDHHVREMTALGLISRRRFREVPPRVEIELTDSGRELLPIAGALARWGMRWMWCDPCDGERVDVGALLLLLPVLLEAQTDVPDGFIETILLSPGGPVRSSFHVGRSRVDEVEHEPSATARIEGNERAWIAALGPARNDTGLHFTGEKRLGKMILGGLPGPAADSAS
jgi:DNA-binding HxlR family transcriptional regulator